MNIRMPNLNEMIRIMRQNRKYINDLENSLDVPHLEIIKTIPKGQSANYFKEKYDQLEELENAMTRQKSILFLIEEELRNSKVSDKVLSLSKKEIKHP